MTHSPLISVHQLLEIYKCPEVLIFDASNGPNAKQNYKSEHLESAVFVDLDSQLSDIKADVSVGGRHPLPEIEAFAKTLSDLGITKQNHIVIYDDVSGANAAARFWWMLKGVGHERVQVLNGGFSHAKKQHFPMSTHIEIPKPAAEIYNVEPWQLPTVEMEIVRKVAQNPDYVVIDVRAKERYDGITEPIDLVAGHIPGAINIPLTENVDANGLFLNPNEIKHKYESKCGGIPPENVIVHCGSGVSACQTILALASAGMHIPNLYVGSWSEWSRN